MNTIAQLQAKIEELELAQQQADRLQQIARQLNTTQDGADLLKILAPPETSWAALYHIIDLDERGKPTWAEVTATWSRAGRSPLPFGSRFHLPQFPFTTLWITDPDSPLFIENVTADHRLDQESQNTILQNQTEALAIVPLKQAGQWIGFISFSWDKPHAFDEAEKKWHKALIPLASPVVASQRLLTQQQQPLTETLYNFSRRLNTIQDEQELLRVLTRPGLETGVTLSALAYFDLDEKDQPTWAEFTATWQREDTPQTTASLIATIWSQIVAAQDTPPTSTGARYYLPEFPFTPLWLASLNEPQLITDIQIDRRLDPKVKNILTQVGIRAMAALSLAYEGRWIGVVSLFWNKPHAFSEEEIAIYRAFTGLASPIMLRRRHIRHLSHQVDEQTEQALTFQALAENAADAIAMCDLAGIYTYANPAFYELLGYSPEELIGSSLDLILPIGTAETAPITDIQNILNGWSGAIELKTKEDHLFPAYLTGSVLTDADETPLALALRMQDRTEQQRLDSWRQQQQTLTDKLNSATDPNEVLAACLTTARQISGMDRGRAYRFDESGAATLTVHQNIEPSEAIANFVPEHPVARLLREPTATYADSLEMFARPELAAGDAQALSAVMVPIHHQQQVIGAFHLASTEAEQLPDSIALPLETLAVYAGQAISRLQIEEELAQTQTQTKQELQQIQAQAEQERQDLTAHFEAELEKNRRESQAVLQQTQTQAEQERQDLTARLEAELEKSRRESQAILQQTQTQAEQERQELTARLEAELEKSRSESQAALQQAHTQAEQERQELTARFEAELEKSRSESQAALQQAHTQAEQERQELTARLEAELEKSRSESQTALQQAHTQAETQLQENRTQAQQKLQQLRQQLETELQQVRSQAETELQQVRSQAETELQQARSQAETELRQTHQQLETELRQTRQQFETELRQTRQQLETELYREEASRNRLLQTISDWVWTVEKEGRIITSNQAGEQVVGYTAQQLEGRSIFDLIPPAEEARLRELFEQTEEESTELTIPWQHQDGSVHFAQCALQPLPEEGLLRGINHDLTPRREAEAERTHFINRFRLAADIADRLNTISDTQSLLQEPIDLLQERLNLYHMQIYLLEEKELVLQAAAGPVAGQLHTEGDTIPLDYKRNLVARAGRGREIALANDVSLEPNFTPHPLLPETAAQLALPLTVDDRLLGVLDAQHNRPDRFEQADIDLLNNLSGIIAAALDNLRLKQAQEEAAAEKATFRQQLVDVEQETIRSLPTPLIPMMNHLLVMPLVGKIDAERTRRITQRMLEGIDRHKAKVVLLDVDGIPAVDSEVANHLNKIVQAAQLKGVQAIVTDLPDSVADTIAG